LSALAIAAIVFVCVFASGLLGLLLRTSLANHHLNEDSMRVVRLGTGLIAQGEGSIPTPFLVVLVLWLAIIFTGFGLVTSRNATVVAILFVCALSVSCDVADPRIEQPAAGADEDFQRPDAERAQPSGSVE
jgi:hypothetical protein